MFSKRRKFSQANKYTREFLESLDSDVRQAGFDDVKIKLPHNLIKTDFQNDELTVRDFVDKGRNFPSVIFIAKNTKQNDLLKILFVNISTKAFFKDDTFPSGHSESPELFVQSSDPARLYGLFGFFYDYLRRNNNTGVQFMQMLGVATAYLLLLFEGSSFLHNKQFIFEYYWGLHLAIDATLTVGALYSLYIFHSSETGLYIKDKESKLSSYFRRAIKGEFRDNPLVSILTGVASGLTVLVMSHFLFG